MTRLDILIISAADILLGHMPAFFAFGWVANLALTHVHMLAWRPYTHSFARRSKVKVDGHNRHGLGWLAICCLPRLDVALLQVGLIVTDGDAVKVTYAHNIDPTQTFGGEAIKNLSKETTTFTLGYAKKLWQHRMIQDGLESFLSSGLGR